MQRRTFIRSSCNSCLLLATGFLMPALSGCGPGAYSVFNAAPADDKLIVPTDAFAKGSLVLVRPKGWFYAIALRKKEDSTYSALLLKCTHQDNQLDASSNGFSCSLHGSAFDQDGRVTKGPAERTLTSFPVTTANNALIIHIRS